MGLIDTRHIIVDRFLELATATSSFPSGVLPLREPECLYHMLADREGEAADELGVEPNPHLLACGGERRHDVLIRRAFPESQLASEEARATVLVDPAHPAHSPADRVIEGSNPSSPAVHPHPMARVVVARILPL